MPTSLPHRFMEVRFPAEFVAEYNKPLQWFPEGSIRGGAQPNLGPGGYGMYAPEWPADDGFNKNAMWHKQKSADAMIQVAERVRGLQVRRMNQMTHMPYQQMAGAYDEMSGGARYGGSPTTIEGADVLSGRGLRGGVMRTLAGRQFIEKRLGSRVRELDNIDREAAGAELIPKPVSEPFEGRETITRLGEHLDALNDAFTSGSIEADTVAQARGLLKALSEVGWQIPQNLITGVQRQVTEMLSIIQQVMGTANPAFVLNADKKKRLRSIFQILERAVIVMDELARVSNLSPQERMMATQAVLPSLGAKVSAQQSRIPSPRTHYNPQTDLRDIYQYPFPPGAPRRTRQRQ